MKAQYVAVWKLHGANKLVSDKDSLELVHLQGPATVARVSADPERYFLHIDRTAAILGLLFKGFFIPEKLGTPEERLSAELENVKARRAKQTEKGVFLIIEGETDIPPPDFKVRRDMDDFSVSLDAIEKPPIRELFNPKFQAILTALGVSLKGNADRQIAKVGEVPLSCRSRQWETHLHLQYARWRGRASLDCKPPD
jgi:hypothetical protein